MTSTQAAVGGDTLVTGPAAVRAALADPRLVVPSVGPATATAADHEHHTTAWLRAEAARFSDGAPHARRRALVTDRLACVPPESLRAAARTTTATILARRPEPVDVMAEIARRVPLRVVGAALGVAEPDLDGLVAAIMHIAPAYQPGAPDHAVRRADEGVARAAAILDAGDDERTANLVAVLVQTCDATAGLIGNTAVAALPIGPTAQAPRYPGIPVAALVHETLRLDPPVRGTRRRTTAPVPELGLPEGAAVFLDFAGANRDPDVFADPDTFDPTRGRTPHLTFGHGPHACPGRDHALAIACGVLEALLAGRRRADTPVAYEPHPVLRIPASLCTEPC